VTPALAASLGAAGANRVSLGVQSFNRRLRRNLGRAGPVEAITGAVEALRAAGFDNIGLDLMFSIPGQTAADLDRDLERTLELKPEHISCYELTVRDGSDFKRRWSRELEAVAAQGRGFYEKVVDRLEDAGYRWYETSNFALPGKECRHNLAYWDGADYIGLGAGAWSTVGLGRWKNLEDINAYIAASGTVRSRAGGFKRARARAGGFKQARFKQARDHERLSGENRLREKLLLGLRRDVGVERGQVAAAIDSEQENLLLRNGFLVNDGGRICLTRRGRFMANEVSARLLRD